MVRGVGIVQQTLSLVTGANLLHFDFVPLLDRVWVTPANFSIAEAEVTPADPLPPCRCGVQKNALSGAYCEIKCTYCAATLVPPAGPFGTSEVSMTPKVSPLDFNSSHNERTSFSWRRSSWRAQIREPFAN